MHIDSPNLPIFDQGIGKWGIIIIINRVWRFAVFAWYEF